MSIQQWCALVISIANLLAVAQADTVVLSAGADQTGTVQITGEIIDYTGRTITVRRADGAEREYPAERVERVDTVWPEDFEAGAAHFEAGDYPRAAERLAAAARADNRAWVRRLAMEKLMGCYAAAGDRATAGRLLVELARSDPATPAIEQAPLAWHATEGVPPATTQEWLAMTTSPVAQLLGASYALTGSSRPAALATLAQLAKSPDQRHAHLAEMQAWRTEIVTAKPSDVARWEQRLREMPESLQVGGWLVLGDVHRQQRAFDAAALAYLRCHLLAARQPQLAAQALWRASRVLALAGEQDEAAKLARQLLQDFPQTAAAREARGVLQSP